MILSGEKLKPVASLEAYAMDPAPFAWGELLVPFSPPLPREGQVIMASYFGDAFVEDEHGAVWWVNGLEARVDRCAISQEQFLERLERDHLLMFKTKLMEQLIKGDRLLPVGKLYGLKKPRSEGGNYHPDNIGTAPIADAFAFMGQQFLNRKAPPPPSSETPTRPKKTSRLWGKKT